VESRPKKGGLFGRVRREKGECKGGCKYYRSTFYMHVYMYMKIMKPTKNCLKGRGVWLRKSNIIGLGI
jgi:hypothetical protein